MKRRFTIILGIISAIVLVCFLFLCGMSWFLRPTIPKPHSDLPITSDLGWWAFQDGLKVTQFTVEAGQPKLNLFNNRFLVRYRLAGTITHRKGWKPRLGQVQITSRLVSRPSDETPSNLGDSSVSTEPKPTTADILLVPIVEVKEDASYAEEPVAFNVTLEQIIRTMNWGTNQYEVHCLDHTATVSVMQSK